MTGKPPANSRLMHEEEYADLLRFAAKKVGVQDAADLVQESYLRFLQRGTERNVQEPRAFLFRIATNLGIDLWRREKLRAQWSSDANEFNAEDFQSTEPGPDEQVHGNDQVDALLGALAELPELERHAFVLNKFEGLSQHEIARRLGLPEKAVQRKIARVIAHCSKRLGYHDDT